MHVIITCSSVCECADSKIPSQAPKSETVKLNNDCGKRVKVSINSPIYRRETNIISLLRTWGRGGPI